MCLLVVATTAVLLPPDVTRLLPGGGESWRSAAAALPSYVDAPLASPEEAGQFVIESLVYNGAPGRYLTSSLTAEVHEREEIDCLALNIYFEARGESDKGKRAVAHVTMNRVADDAFPSTVCAVIREGGTVDPLKCQFTWWCDARSNQPFDIVAWQDSLEVAEQVYRIPSEDLTGGALWYHADYVAPPWRRRLEPGPKIGSHIFYRRDRGLGQEARRVETLSDLEARAVAEHLQRRLKEQHFPPGPSQARRPGVSAFGGV